MSTQAQTTAPAADRDTPLTDDDVARYLADNPGFFEKNASLLALLTLPHQTGGSAVSLVERQVAILRQRNEKLDRKLRDLMNVAHSNDALSKKLHALTMLILDATSAHSATTLLEEGLRVEFGADQNTLILFSEERRYAGLDDLPYVRHVPTDSADLQPFKTFIDASRPRCGQIRDAQRAFLFGQDNLHIGSTALVPLGRGCDVGILAIGSQDSTRFHPGMGTDFLGRLGE
ncbi:MAG: DUF484 family protein, partial [Pseudomonadota bacterium]